MFIERTGWDSADQSLERVELVAFLTDDMEDDFRDSLRSAYPPSHVPVGVGLS